MEDTELVNQELERVATSIGIPPCPAILIELSAEVRSEEPDFSKIEQLVVKDVGLSATLIKTVNSPFYGLRTKVGTVRQSINTLGLNMLSRTITGLVLRNSFVSKDPVSMERFWDASAKTAMSASYLAKHIPGINRDDAYTFGLFQNCGIPVLMQRFPEYKQTLGLANNTSERNFTQIEDETHSTNHATIGYLLTKSWNMPETLSTAVRFHHDYQALTEENERITTPSRNLMAIGLLADHIVTLHSKQNFSLEWIKGGKAALSHFGLSEAEFNELSHDVITLLE